MKKELIIKFYAAYRLIIFPAVVGLCCLILISFVIIPQFLKLLNLRTLEQENLKRSGILEAKAAELINFDPEDIKRKTSLALNVLPQDKDYPGALGVVEDLFEQNVFVVDSLSLSGGGSATPSESQSYTINARVSGQKTLLLPLIKNIENASRVMRVGSVEIAPSKESSAVSATLSINILYSSAEGKAGGSDAPVQKLSAEEEQVLAKLGSLLSLPDPVEFVSGGDGQRGKQNPFE